MASSTSPLPHLPEETPPPNPHEQQEHQEPTESEPLLGRPGDAIQRPHSPMYRNLYLGMNRHPNPSRPPPPPPLNLHPHPRPQAPPPPPNPHPLLQSLGLFIIIQAILILQPTTKAYPETKSRAAKYHASLHLLSFLLFLSGTVIIETNKQVNSLPHFHSVHAYLGVTTLSLLLVQYLFGFTIYVTPKVWGGEEKAKQLWKWHRYVGYGVLILLLATAGSAAWTDYVETQLGVSKLGVTLGLVLIAAGVYPRVQLGKLGLREY
ncbi:eukaryotic cytochrome b561-domain-containing protein [Apiosordaria backusii]|uniref:Eukaryotic cytochrome b561-domain-containing protein n=1 Tax=Apiosordaria backusii TaxID=314023 RepID=A0AA40EXU5_9PEZI|nr:eukaryotic cytochrome b561-domain-containing protein [Apiosordaria backusii]